MLPITVHNDLYFARNLASKSEKNIKNFKNHSPTQTGKKKKKCSYFHKISTEIYILTKNWAFWSIFVDFMSFWIFQLNNREMPKIRKKYPCTVIVIAKPPEWLHRSLRCHMKDNGPSYLFLHNITSEKVFVCCARWVGNKSLGLVTPI